MKEQRDIVTKKGWNRGMQRIKGMTGQRNGGHRYEATEGYSNKDGMEQRDAKDQRDDGTKEWRTQI